MFEDDPETFAAFNAEDVAEEDYPKIVQFILETRRTEALPCKKLSLYSDGYSASEMSLMNAKYATSSSEWISQQVNLTPCYTFQPFAVDAVVDITPPEAEANPCEVDNEEGEQEDGDSYRRMLSHKSKKGKKGKKSRSHSSDDLSPECQATWDRSEYYSKISEYKNTLSYGDYKEFYG